MSFKVFLNLHAFEVMGLQPWSFAMLNFCGSIQPGDFLLQKTQKCRSFTDTCGYKTELHTGSHTLEVRNFSSRTCCMRVSASQRFLPEEDSVLCKVHDTAVIRAKWHVLTCKINICQSSTLSRGRILCAK